MARVCCLLHLVDLSYGSLYPEAMRAAVHVAESCSAELCSILEVRPFSDVAAERGDALRFGIFNGHSSRTGRMREDLIAVLNPREWRDGRPGTVWLGPDVAETCSAFYIQRAIEKKYGLARDSFVPSLVPFGESLPA